ncbi:hypothetical protein EYD45_09405 [Hyunsoonleella flava]|uniref:Uncharacterized protein n=1 Tax=Hyunsoonleella flava TaxID=2527939 RepID=A0A4Q9FJ04_9FLAO|nr:hypothetical protein [Hyunsoonleella flava]TBN03222.1 hypothetical protein EYD45_09405 [Hyunsoonleella flava]
MNYFIKIITLFIVCSFIFSCNTKENEDGLLLDIDFGITDDEYKTKIAELVDRGVLKVQTINKEISDTIQTRSFYKRDLKIGSFSALVNVNFNSGDIKTGPLRNYTYHLLTSIIKKSDSINSNKDSVSDKLNDSNSKGYPVIAKKSDIDKIRAYLDKTYGNGVNVEIKEGLFLSEKIMYSSNNEDIILELGRLTIKGQDSLGFPANISSYNNATLEIRSKKYAELLSNEYSRLKNGLKPQDVIEVKFGQPVLEYDEGLEKGFVINAEKILFKANFLNDKILEFKGELRISDTFNETLLIQNNFLYTFNEPLEKVNIYELFGIEDPNLISFIFYPKSHNYDKIKNIILSGRRLKIELFPTAVVLESGEVIQ